MLILGVETSCDDTCVGILKFKDNKVEILANITYSQIGAHQEYGGVFPNVAIREHKKNITKTLLTALKKANFLEKNHRFFKKDIVDEKKKMEKIKEILKDKGDGFLFEDFQKITKYQKPKIDYLSITIGPGLDPCLWVGVNFTKALSVYWDIPIIPVNHIEGHIFANFVGKNSKILRASRANSFIPNSKNIFPAICLIVSGGHTQLILMDNVGKYKIIGETRDDAAGECFDKVAKILGLGYPGGPAVAAQAAKFSYLKRSFKSLSQAKVFNFQFSIRLPRPMKYQKNFDFSFSGLKTAVLYDFKSRTPEIQKNEEYIKEISYKAQEAIIDLLLYKTFKAAEKYNIKTIILGGGVSANSKLRSEIKKEAKLKNLTSLIPPKKLSVDNGVMIAITAYFKATKLPKNKVLRAKQFNQNQTIKEINKIKVDSNLRFKNN